MMNGLDNFLFSRKVNNGMAALDDQTSMFSVAARDAVGSSGRIAMEYKRDKHGGRERFVEEALTLLIWGFGVRAIKQVYDAGMLGPLKSLGVELPDLDTGMLPNTAKGAKVDIKPGEQTLTKAIVKDFNDRFGKDVRQYAHLSEILNGKTAAGLQAKYRASSVAKFGLASIVPATAIAFGIPKLNQWWTRQLISRESQGKQTPANQTASQTNLKQAPSQQAGQLRQMANPWGVAAMAASPFAAHPFASRMASNVVPNATSNFSTAPASGAVIPAGSTPGAQFGAQPSFAAPSPQGHPGGQVRFGGLGSAVSNVASTILQNEQYNTLLIDGVISGGRTYTARNPVERKEIIFREASLIAFLYFAQGHIQNAINKGLGKMRHVPTALGFHDLKYLKQESGQKNFIDKFEADKEAFNKRIEQKLNAYSAKDIKATGSNFPKENQAYKTKALVETVHEYFLNEERKNAKNMVFESAIASGHIPTFQPKAENPGLWQQMKEIGKEMNPAAERNLTNNGYLDLTKKINTDAIFDMEKGMSEMVKSVTETGKKELPDMLKRIMRLRASSLVASNVACFLALSVVFPWMQHQITYRLTGKDYFPGVQKP